MAGAAADVRESLRNSPRRDNQEKEARFMKYTFTAEDGREKTVNIPDEVIMANRRIGLNMREAIELYLSDEGYITNPVVEELNAKAKASGVTRAASTTKRKPPTRKPDMDKRIIISTLNDFLQSEQFFEITGREVAQTEVTNIERIIAFTLGDDKYELTLSKKRKPKT